MKKVYTISANGTSPTVLTGVLVAHGITHLFDIRRSPNHHFSNVQRQFIEMMFNNMPGLCYEHFKLIERVKFFMEDGEHRVNSIGQEGLSMARDLMKSAPVPCFLGSDTVDAVPGEATKASHWSMLLEKLCKESNGTYAVQHLDGRALYKDILQSFKLHQGQGYDIRQMFEKINQEYFDSRYRAEDIVMIWEPMRRVRPRKLGYFRYPSVIALNPVLDQREVPQEIAEAVLYHEMVHLQLAHDGLPFEHTVEFFQKEALFADYAKRFRFDFSEAFAALDAVDPE